MMTNPRLRIRLREEPKGKRMMNNRLDRAVSAPTLFLQIAVLFFAVGATGAAEQPNVLIFLTDDQGTLDAHCYGTKYLHTPNIDKLAATGVRFTQAYAHSFLLSFPGRAAHGTAPAA